MEKVRKDKLREVKAGHDGTWVAHPGLVSVAKEIFDKYMPEPNQISSHVNTAEQSKHSVSAKDLIEVPKGEITEKGLRWNIDVGLQYLYSWLGGLGCVPIYNLMEDAATAEISRAQVWQWVKFKSNFADGKPITAAMVKEIIHHRAGELGSDAKLKEAAQVLDKLTTSPEFAEFLTLASYELLD
jgi:malate synthase